jgi:hypothetical protein
VVPLDDDCARDFAIAAPLKLRADVDYHAAPLDGLERLVGLKTNESGARAAQQAVQSSVSIGVVPRGKCPGVRHVWRDAALH